MTVLRDVIEVAQSLVDRMGSEGHLLIAQRAREHEQEGEAESATFWAMVARAMELLTPRDVRLPGERDGAARRE
jgi:hypothetical protein